MFVDIPLLKFLQRKTPKTALQKQIFQSVVIFKGKKRSKKFDQWVIFVLPFNIIMSLRRHVARNVYTFTHLRGKKNNTQISTGKKVIGVDMNAIKHTNPFFNIFCSCCRPSNRLSMH